MLLFFSAARVFLSILGILLCAPLTHQKRKPNVGHYSLFLFLTPGEHGKEDHPTGPQVGRLRVVLRSDEHLRGDVGHGSASALQQALPPLVAEDGGHPEVGDLEHVPVRKEQVLRLDVAVRNAAAVQVLLEEKLYNKLRNGVQKRMRGKVDSYCRCFAGPLSLLVCQNHDSHF